jgi:hypothetical protein
LLFDTKQEEGRDGKKKRKKKKREVDQIAN